MSVDPDETVLNSSAESDQIQIVDTSQTEENIETSSPYPLRGLGKLLKPVDDGMSPVIPTIPIHKYNTRRTSTPSPKLLGMKNFVLPWKQTKDHVNDGGSDVSEILIPSAQLIHAMQLTEEHGSQSRDLPTSQRSDCSSPLFDLSEDMTTNESQEGQRDTQADSVVFGKTTPAFKVPVSGKVLKGKYKPPPQKKLPMSTSGGQAVSIATVSVTNEASDSQETLPPASQTNRPDVIAIESPTAHMPPNAIEDVSQQQCLNDTQDTEISVSLLPQSEPVRSQLPLEGILGRKLSTGSQQSDIAGEIGDIKRRKSVSWHDSVDRDASSSKSSQSSLDHLPSRIVKKHEQELRILEKVDLQMRKVEQNLNGPGGDKKDQAMKIMKPMKPLLDQIHKAQFTEYDLISVQLKKSTNKSEKRELHGRFRLLKERQKQLVSVYRLIKSVTATAQDQGSVDGNYPLGGGPQRIREPGLSQSPERGTPLGPLSQLIAMSPPSFSASPASSTGDLSQLTLSPEKRILGPRKNKRKQTSSPQIDKKQRVISAAQSRQYTTTTGITHTASAVINDVAALNTSINSLEIISDPGQKSLGAGQTVQGNPSLRAVSEQEEAMVNQLLLGDSVTMATPSTHSPITTTTVKGLRRNESGLQQLLVTMNVGTPMLPSEKRSDQPLSRTDQTGQVVSRFHQPGAFQSPPAKLRAPSVSDFSPDLETSIQTQKRRPENKRMPQGYDRRESTSSQKEKCVSKPMNSVGCTIGDLPVKEYPSLKILIERKMINPGQNVLSFRAKDETVFGSMLLDGNIRSSWGEMFSTPTRWCIALLSASRNNSAIKKQQAYERVLYSGTPLSQLPWTPLATISSHLIQAASSQQQTTSSQQPTTSSQKQVIIIQSQGSSHVHGRASLSKPITSHTNLLLTRTSGQNSQRQGLPVQSSHRVGLPIRTPVYKKHPSLNSLLADAKFVHIAQERQFEPVENVLPGYRWNQSGFTDIDLPGSLIEQIDVW